MPLRACIKGMPLPTFLACHKQVLLGSGSNGDFIFSITILYYIFIILPSIAMTVRRLHDVGQSGWMVLLNLVPYVGGVVILVFTCLDSQPNENKYGPNPKKVDTDDNKYGPSPEKVEAEILPESNTSSFPAYCSNCGQKTTSGNYCAKCGKDLRS